MSWLADREEFIHLMAREGLSLKDTRVVLRAGSTIQRLAVEDCSRQLTEREIAMAERLEKRIHMITADMGWPSPLFGGDPRGCVVKVRVPSGYTNDWGREGVCVPTRRW